MLKDMKQAGIATSVVLFALTLSACGGGGGGSSDSKPKAQSTDLKPGVYFTGRVFSDGSTAEGIGLLSKTGKLFSTLGKGSFTFADVTFSDSGKISGQLEELRLSEESGENAWVKATGTLSGEVESSEEATLTPKAGDLSTNIVLVRNNKPSAVGITLEKIATTYTSTDPSSSITINTNGVLEGGDFEPEPTKSDTDCTFSGQVVIPDETVNVFEVTYDAEGCSGRADENASDTDRNGTYSGLGTYNEAEGELVFYSQNGTVARKFTGTR